MKITAITRYKHGELYAMLHRIGWTQVELARQTNLSAYTIGGIINLVKRPTPEQADAIQKALATAGEYLDVLLEWPETFEGLKRGCKHEQTADVELESLIGCREAMMLQAPEPEHAAKVARALDEVMDELPERYRDVLTARYLDNKTLKEIGKQLGVSAPRARQVVADALRKMRHPSRISRLESVAHELAS